MTHYPETEWCVVRESGRLPLCSDVKHCGCSSMLAGPNDLRRSYLVLSTAAAKELVFCTAFVSVLEEASFTVLLDTFRVKLAGLDDQGWFNSHCWRSFLLAGECTQHFYCTECMLPCAPFVRMDSMAGSAVEGFSVPVVTNVR